MESRQHGKTALRREADRAVATQPCADARAEDAFLQEFLIGLSDMVRSTPGGFLTAFLPMEGEPDFLSVLLPLAREGKLGLVRCLSWKDPSGLEVRLWEGRQDSLVHHPRMPALQEPGEACPPVQPPAGSVILVPGAAFGPEGARSGRGGGFYDRFLACRPDLFRLGIAREPRWMPAVPRESHDQSVDALATGRGLRLFPGPRTAGNGDFSRIIQYLGTVDPEHPGHHGDCPA